MTKIYCARWVLPDATDVLTGGAVAVEGERVAAVGVRDEVLRSFPSARVEDFGEAAILPGLVNCHTHLELTALRGFLDAEEHDFARWLRKLTVARLERMTADDLYVSAAWGAVEALRAGVTCVGDASDGAVNAVRALADSGLRGIVYQEVFGPDPSLAREQMGKLRAKVDGLRAFETGRVRIGVSPHAPYTVSGPLLELVAGYAAAESLPLMIHAAESRAEFLFMREGRGPFAESLARRAIGWRAPGVSTIQYLKERGVLAAQTLLAHCVTADEDDIRTIKEAGAGVAHCPKSNAKLGHGRAPFAAFLGAQLAVGLGSDSVGSNNTCDLLEEARFAALLARAGGDEVEAGRGVAAADVLRAATGGGAKALGLESKVGALAVGSQADLAIVSLGGAHQAPVHDPASALVFASSGRDVLLTVVAGRELYRDGRVTSVDEERLRARLAEIKDKLVGPSL